MYMYNINIKKMYSYYCNNEMSSCVRALSEKSTKYDCCAVVKADGITFCIQYLSLFVVKLKSKLHMK